MDNFRVIYKILKYLEAALDCGEADPEAFSSARLKVSDERIEQLLIMMQDEGYICGLVVVKTLGDNRRHIAEPICPSITIRGLEYLEENSLMKKAANAAKGIKDFIR